jgi:hypothetical protein
LLHQEGEHLLQTGEANSLPGGWVFQRSMPIGCLRLTRAPQAEYVRAAAHRLLVFIGSSQWFPHLPPVYQRIVSASSMDRQVSCVTGEFDGLD